MNLSHKSLLFLLGIVASSSTAASFGTPLSRVQLNKKVLVKPTFHFRGGSDEVEAAAVSTELFAEAPEQPAEPVAEEPEVSKAMLNMGPKATQPGFVRKLLPSFPWYSLPNLLTYARCIAIPGLVAHFYMSQSPDKNIVSALIFAIASITDYLDGFLARRWDICSPFGAFLDPVADKLMVSTALILLAGKYGAVVALPSSIILAREIAVSALREWMASRGERDSVAVGWQGKCKTALTMLSLSIVLAIPDGWTLASTVKPAVGWDLVMNVGMIMLYASAVLTVTSGSVYFKAAAPVLMGKK